MTRWLLNSAVLPAGAYGIYRYTESSAAELADYLHQPGVVSRVGYSETAAVIERWTGVRVEISREASPLEPGDVAMVVRLCYRVDPRTKGAPQSPRDEDWEIARLERVDATDEQTAALRQVRDRARTIRSERDLRVLDEETIRLRSGGAPRTWQWVMQWVVLRERTGRWEALRGLGTLSEPLYRGSAANRDDALVLAVRAWRAWAPAAYAERDMDPPPSAPRVVVVGTDDNAWDAVDAGRGELSAEEIARVLRETPEPTPPATKDERRAARRAAKRGGT